MEAVLVWIALGMNGPLQQATPNQPHYYAYFETEPECLGYAREQTKVYRNGIVTCSKGYVGRQVYDEQLAFQKRTQEAFRQKGLKVP